MILLYHLCIFADPISDILCNVDARRHDNNVEFFVRDLLHFFGNLINTSDTYPELKFAACKYFLRFCKNILPAVAEYFKPFLNFVVSVLVPIIKKNDHEPLTACSMELLKFLIDDQVNELRDAIAVLDRFPSQTIFTHYVKSRTTLNIAKENFHWSMKLNIFCPSKSAKSRD